MSENYRLRLVDSTDRVLYQQDFDECPNVPAIARAANPPSFMEQPADGHLSGLREAALGVLRDAGEPLTAAQLWQQLATKGFPVDNKRHAGRALHAAFINCPNVERVGVAKYEYAPSPSP